MFVTRGFLTVGLDGETLADPTDPEDGEPPLEEQPERIIDFAINELGLTPDEAQELLDDLIDSQVILGLVEPGDADDLNDAVLSQVAPKSAIQAALAAIALHEGESKRIDKAIKEITKSLKDKRWEDDFHLDTKDGKQTFDRIKKAVKELEKALKKDDLSPEAAAWAEMAIEDLVSAVRTLAQGKIADTANAPELLAKDQKKVDKELDKARKEVDKGDKDRDKGKPDKAIDHYKKAWEHAVKAMKKQS